MRLSFYGKETNLHAIWDGGIIEEALGLHLGPNYSFDHEAVRQAAVRLDATITSADRASWCPSGTTAHLESSVVGWANQSHGLAKSVAYPDLPQDRSGDWSDAYEKAAWPVVQGQLERAGVCLGEVLNEALR